MKTKRQLRQAKREAWRRRRNERVTELRQNLRELRCFWTWPFGHPWEGVPWREAGPRLGPVYKCPFCGAKNYGNTEQSIGG